MRWPTTTRRTEQTPAREEVHPGDTTCDRYDPDCAGSETCHAMLDGRSCLFRPGSRPCGDPHDHHRAGTLRSRSLWLLRSYRFCGRADRLCPFGRTDTPRVLRPTGSVRRIIYGALWPKPLASSLDPVSVSRRSRSTNSGSLAHPLSRGCACSQTVSFSRRFV